MDQKKGKILIVDDDRDILLTTKVVLKHEFALIETCSVPSSIPALLTESEYDVILLDMNFSRGVTSGKEGIH